MGLAGGLAANGGAVSSGGSGVVTPSFWLPSANTGAKIETIPRFVCSGNGGALVSQKLYLVALPTPLKAGVTYSGIAFFSGGTAAGTPLNQWFTLVNASNLQTLRSTVDDTSTAWATNSLKRLALSSTFTPGSDTNAYVGCLVNATTVPTLVSSAAINSPNLTGLAPAYNGGSSTALTTPVADGTTVAAIVSTNIVAYAYVD